MNNLRMGQEVHYARIIPNIGYFEVLGLVVRTIEDTWFACLEKKTKQAYLFNNTDIGKTIFTDRSIALKLVKDAESEFRKKGITFTEYVDTDKT